MQKSSISWQVQSLRKVGAPATSISAGEADHERPEEAAGGDGVGAAESGGAAEGRAVHAEPAQAPAGAWRDV